MTRKSLSQFKPSIKVLNTFRVTTQSTSTFTMAVAIAGQSQGVLGFVATGGTVSNITGYRVHTFTSSGEFIVTSGSANVEYLVVAGGGGGGSPGNPGSSIGTAGGGAGGFRSSVIGEPSGRNSSAEPLMFVAAGNTYQITVGGGGNGSLSPTQATQGSNSISYLAFANPAISDIISTGGGIGGSRGQFPSGGVVFGGSGGSGGGGASHPTVSPAPNRTTPGGSGTFFQGFSGGAGFTQRLPVSRSSTGGGGGGGAGDVGGQSSASSPSFFGGSGGTGLASPITGTPVVYAGGGGGIAGVPSGTGGPGGSGGGGRGADSGASGTATSGNTNTGGGGGALRNGGSGIVIIRYAV